MNNIDAKPAPNPVFLVLLVACTFWSSQSYEVAVAEIVNEENEVQKALYLGSRIQCSVRGAKSR